MTLDDADWWRHAVVYQIYPRSFADANGDGIGDLRGVIDRVPYLARLGIDAVWLSPFYPSALADGGYDVDDYRDVDPRLGTLADVDLLIARLAEHDIRLIIDIVPNHTSDRHEWFLEALASPAGSPQRARYHFREGGGDRGDVPPADWRSGFGGLMWTRVDDGQWYLHIHAKEQPDLNWANREVRDDFLSTLRFWADRGVAGFRVDVAHLLAKELPEALVDEQLMAHAEPGSHPLVDRDEVHEIYREWRAVFDEYVPPRMAVAEAWVPVERRARYASPEGLGQAFNFDLLRANWDADEFFGVIDRNLNLALGYGASSTWVLSNHDVVRHATRYGLPQGTPELPQDAKAWLLARGTEPALDRELGRRRARAATLLLLALPGSTYLYQGEELGLHEVEDLPDGVRQDPTFVRTLGADPGRDGCRVPLPWTPTGPSLGFGPCDAHLPQPASFADAAVAIQEADPKSTLAFYRAALALRKRLPRAGGLTWRAAPAGVLHLERPDGWHCVTCFDGVAPMPEGRVVLASAEIPDPAIIPSHTTVWILNASTTPTSQEPA